MSKVIIIEKAWCKGCGICVAFCPVHALELVDGKATLRANASCVLCGTCEKHCPDYAVYIEKRGDSDV